MNERNLRLDAIGSECANLVITHLRNNKETTTADDLDILVGLSFAFLNRVLEALEKIDPSKEKVEMFRSEFEGQISLLFQQTEQNLKQKMN